MNNNLYQYLDNYYKQYSPGEMNRMKIYNDNGVYRLYETLEQIENYIKSYGLIVMNCSECDEPIITSSQFGSGAYVCHNEKCSANHDILRFDFMSQESIEQNQRDNWSLLYEYAKKKLGII